MSDFSNGAGTAVRKTVGCEVVAGAFNVSKPTVRRLARTGVIPCYQVGAMLRFDLAEVSAALRMAPAQKPQPALNLAAA